MSDIIQCIEMLDILTNISSTSVKWILYIPLYSLIALHSKCWLADFRRCPFISYKKLNYKITSFHTKHQLYCNLVYRWLATKCKQSNKAACPIVTYIAMLLMSPVVWCLDIISCPQYRIRRYAIERVKTIHSIIMNDLCSIIWEDL